MDPQEVIWSDFCREPSKVFPLLERGGVVLRRRGEEALHLSLESREQAGREGVGVLARVLSEILVREELREVLAERLLERIAWARFLPNDDRVLFVQEFIQCAEACVDLGEMAPLGQLVQEWKSTARLHAEGLDAELRAPLAGAGNMVQRP